MYISPPVDRSFLLFPSDCTNVPTGRPPLPAHGHARAATQPRPAGPPAAPLSQRAEPQPGSARGDARWFGRKGFALWFCASAGHFYFLLSLPPHPPTYRPPPPPQPSPPGRPPVALWRMLWTRKLAILSPAEDSPSPLCHALPHRAVVSQTGGEGSFRKVGSSPGCGCWGRGCRAVSRAGLSI